jgi:hypothetical protein
MKLIERNRLIEANVLKAVRDGPHLRPHLRYDYNVIVIARDRAAQRVLLDGVGSLGVGQVWQSEEPRHAQYPGYADAPEQKCELP